MAGPREASEPRPIDVQQITRAGPLVAPSRLPRQPRRTRDPRSAQRPRHRRVRVPGLAGDQPWSPAPPTPRAAQIRSPPPPAGVADSAPAARAIHQAGERRALLLAGSPPAPMPALQTVAGETLKRFATSRHLQPLLARLHERRSARRVRAWRYGEASSGPLLVCESSQTHSLEGGPDVPLSRSQPVEARHLELDLTDLAMQREAWIMAKEIACDLSDAASDVSLTATVAAGARAEGGTVAGRAVPGRSRVRLDADRRRLREGGLIKRYRTRRRSSA